MHFAKTNKIIKNKWTNKLIKTQSQSIKFKIVKKIKFLKNCWQVVTVIPS